MILFLAHTDSVACSLNPTAKIVTDPDGTVFYHSDPVVLDGTTSTAKCGSIDQYRWQIDDVTVSWNSVYSHTFNLASGESDRVFKVQLRVRNTAGKFGYKTIYVTVTRNNKGLYYLTDHLGSVRVTVNEQGDPVGWDDYYPFGLAELVPKTFGMPGRTQNASNPDDDQKFTGYELEQQGDLNLYHAGARMYDPVIGRFTSHDRFKEKYPSMSPYQYAANNPVLFVDVNGDSLLAIFDADGNFLETKASKDGEFRGIILNEEGAQKYTFSFNDENDVARFGNGDEDFNRIAILRSEDINKFLDEAGVSGGKNFFSRVAFAFTESIRQGKMDFVTSLDPDTDLFVAIGEGIGFNDFDAGNFIWGAAMEELGFSFFSSKVGSEVNNFFSACRQNSCKNEFIPGIRFGPANLGDSPSDQRAILQGFVFQRVVNSQN